MPCSDCNPAFTALPKLKECRLLSRSRSNQAPVTTERTELNELVAHAEKELIQYRETIARLHDMIIALQNEREHLKEQVQLAKSLATPIRRLPPEILHEVFIHHGVTNTIDPNLGAADSPGLRLASICSHWRSIALGTPALWNEISARLRAGQHSYVALVENLLRLSARSKLHITINARADVPVPAYLPLLCDQANRWESMAGTLLGRNQPLLDVLSSIQRRLDALQTCDILAPFSDYSAWVEGATRLRTATVFNIVDSGTRVAIPWSNIVHLILRQSYPPRIAGSLANLPNLRSLQIDYPRVQDIDDANYAVPEQPFRSNLSSLKILIGKGDHEIHMTRLLEMLILPMLQSLSIVSETPGYKTNQGDIWWASKELPSLISRSSATITSLHLDRAWVPTGDLITLLRKMPALTTLSLSEPSYDTSDISPMLNNQLLSNMAFHQGRQPILTRLTSLTLKGCRLADFGIPLFVKVVHSRWRPSVLVEDEVACIKTVRLGAAIGSIDRNAVQSLMMLRTRGLDILIEDENGTVPLWEEE